jgi:hypothetical protein
VSPPNPVIAELDEALVSFSEASVALAALYPAMVFMTGNRVAPEAREFVEDGMDALGRARRHVNEARRLLDEGTHSVKVER